MGFTLNMAEAGILGITGATVYNYPDTGLGDTLRIDSINLLGTAANPYTLAIPDLQPDMSAIAPGTGIIIKRLGDTVVNLTGTVDGVTYDAATPLMLEEVNDGFTLTYSNVDTGWVSASAAGGGGDIEFLTDIGDVETGGVVNGDILVYDGETATWRPGSVNPLTDVPLYPFPESPTSMVATVFAAGNVSATLTVTATSGVNDNAPVFTYNWFNENDPTTSLGTADNITITDTGTYIVDVTETSSGLTDRVVSAVTINAGPLADVFAVNPAVANEGDELTIQIEASDAEELSGYAVTANLPGGGTEDVIPITTVTGTTLAVTHTINAGNWVSLVLRIVDAAAASDTQTVALTITPNVALATVTGTAAGAAGRVNFSGNVTNDGGGTVAERGFYTSTRAISPNDIAGATRTVVGAGTGTFSTGVSASEGTRVYGVPFAVNEAGEARGAASNAVAARVPNTFTIQNLSNNSPQPRGGMATWTASVPAGWTITGYRWQVNTIQFESPGNEFVITRTGSFGTNISESLPIATIDRRNGNTLGPSTTFWPQDLAITATHTSGDTHTSARQTAFFTIT